MRRLRRQLVPLAVQVAVVCTVLVAGLVPLTAPLPPLGGGAAIVTTAAGIVLAGSVAALGAIILVPRWFRWRTCGRTLAAAGTGSAAAVVVFLATPGLITRPLLLVAAGALLVVACETARQKFVTPKS